MTSDLLVQAPTPLIPVKSLFDIEGKKIDFFIKNETAGDCGLFTDRFARRLLQLIQEKESLKSKEILVDFFRPMMTLSVASLAVRMGLKMIVFYDQHANQSEINLLRILDCEMKERVSRKEIAIEINTHCA